ncbi:MAG: hypothetical protein JNN00_15680 [Chitinophagaceae bacterium]|nr:hypothetical protein [Chitinophagaceae bacterium]
MKKGQMPAFIQAIYGTVLGVSSFNFYLRIKDHTSLHTDFWDGLSSGPVLFDFFFFIMTLLIIAHDWFSYHDNEPDPGRNYYYYIGDVLALFFVAQMFAVANYEGIRYWYLFGLGYTLCNIGNFIRDWSNGKIKDKLIWKKGGAYLVHIAVVILSLWLLPEVHSTYTSEILVGYAWWISGTAVLILALWLLIDNHQDKGGEKSIGTISVSSTIDLKITDGHNKADHRHTISLQEKKITKENLSAGIFQLLNEDKGIKTSDHRNLLEKLKAFVKYKKAAAVAEFKEDEYFKTSKEYEDFIKGNKDKETEDLIAEFLK